jgi:hypothetical protein
LISKPLESQAIIVSKRHILRNRKSEFKMHNLVPVVIGVGEFINRSTRPEDAKEPLELILSAVNHAIDDSQTSHKKELLSSIDSVEVVLSWTWPYADLPGLLARRLGITPRRTETSPHGGNQPGKIFDEAARRVARGETQAALLAGGESLASRTFSRAFQRLTPSLLTSGSCELRGKGGASAPRMDAGGEGCEIGVLADYQGIGSGCVGRCLEVVVLMRPDIGGAHSMGAPITVRKRSCFTSDPD